MQIGGYPNHDTLTPHMSLMTQYGLQGWKSPPLPLL